jgi:hypothetical protein
LIRILIRILHLHHILRGVSNHSQVFHIPNISNVPAINVTATTTVGGIINIRSVRFRIQNL